MPIRPYAPAGPSIHSTIYIPARGPFALCQAILIPIYHLFLAAPSFLSARSSSARPSFLNPSTPIGFFRGLSFGRLSSSLYPSSSLLRAFSSSSSASLPFHRPLSFSLPRSFSTIRRYECEFVLLCRSVRSNALSYFWLPRGRRQSERGICERKAHDDREGTAETSDWTRQLHALLHTRGERLRDPTAWKIDR